MRIKHLTEKLNPNVRFRYIDDSEGDKNRGWTVDKIVAYLDNEEVGYLKLSYIPLKRFEEYYPGILNYISQIGGSSILPHDYQKTPWQKIPVNELRKCIYHIAQAAKLSWNESNALQTKADQSDDSVVRNIVADLVKILTQEKGILFNRFKQYYVDKPIVDYIRVKDGFKRQGIGTALYRAGYEWMKSKGLSLYASGIQSAEAKATWKAMQNQFPIKHERSSHPYVRHKRINRRRFE